MRVCLLSAEYPPARGGVGDYTQLLAGELAAAGADVSVLTQRRAGSVPQLPGVSVASPVGAWGFGCWAPLVAYLRRARPEILHLQYQTAAYGMHPAINLLPWRLRTSGWQGRVVTTFHDLRPPYLFPKAGAARDLPAMFLAWGSDAVVLVAEEHWHCRPLAWLRRLRPDLSQATRVIPIGSNIPALPPAGFDRAAWRRGLGVAEDETLLVFFGFLNRSKGARDLLRALARLRDAGVPARLLLVGGGDDSNAQDAAERRACAVLVAELGLRDRVVETGYAAPAVVSGHLLAADLCVLPFLDGATFQRGTLLAALAHGLPIISTQPARENEGGSGPTAPFASARLVHGENVWLVPPGQPEALAVAVTELRAAPSRRLHLGDGARQLGQSLNWSSIAARHLELYQQLMTPVGPAQRQRTVRGGLER